MHPIFDILTLQDSNQCSTHAILTKTETKEHPGYYIHSSASISYHNHLLAASVGFANLFPKFTVTRLCRATVEISNGNAWFCCKLAVLSGSAAALVVVPATADCAGTLVGLLTLGSAGSAGAAAWLPPVLLEAEAEAEVAADADAEIAASPDATMVTPGPAGAAADPARRPAVVRVAELMLVVELLLEEAMACWAPGGAGPATTVMADAMVCIVLAAGPLDDIEPSWKG
jgi:hypothetical protein